MIDKYGEALVADLRFHFQVDIKDVIEGRGPSPYFLLMYLQRLPYDSMTVALMRGSRDFFGWTREAHLLADVYDALNINTRATGNWGKNKAPKIPAYERPVATQPTKPKVSVKSLFARMQKGV